MAAPWLKDNSIILRSPEPEDLELMYTMENDTELWSVGNTTLPYSRYTLKRYLETSCQDIVSEQQARFVIETLDGNSCGMIDLAEYDPINSRAEVCIGILSGYRRQGIAAKALELLCNYATERLHLHQLYAYVPEWNQESLNLFQKSGFTPNATLKEWQRTENGYNDIIVMQRLFKG